MPFLLNLKKRLIKHFLFLFVGVGGMKEPHQSRRSIMDMEKALSVDSTASSRMSLYKEVMKANVSNCNSPAGNHLTVSSTPVQPLKATPKKFDMKLICPHGMKKSLSLSIELQM